MGSEQLMNKAREALEIGRGDDLLDVLRLLRECVTLKNVQISLRALCFQALLDHNILGMVPGALLHSDPRIRAAAAEVSFADR